MDLDNASYHFSQLLIGKPCYWTALARLIEVMRRSGSLDHALLFLQRAEQATLNSELCPGLNYCRGLYDWYIENPNNALRHFNIARRDNEWGAKAILNMIEICINPDGEIPNENDMSELGDAGDFSDARVIALRTADRLLKELRSRPKIMDEEINYQLLQNYLKLASKQRVPIESALQDLTELCNREETKNKVGPTLGVATAFVLLRQTQRAKNQLKRLARMPWNFEEAEYLERGWLLLADIYIKANKLDLSVSLIERVLEYNKSCTKAFELAGYISEKSQQFAESTKHYMNAWNCCGKSRPHIGYKLAYNYMKNKNIANAVDVCHQVLKMHPDYTIIRTEILDKCRNSIRT